MKFTWGDEEITPTIINVDAMVDYLHVVGSEMKNISVSTQTLSVSFKTIRLYYFAGMIEEHSPKTAKRLRNVAKNFHKKSPLYKVFNP
jgi:hypothetical protein